MAIDVTCAGCKTRFQVSDKFAGKQGPCPKCKSIIKIPTKKDEVVIHAPEPSGPKDSKGRLVLQPIFREETKLTPVHIAIIVGSIVGLLFISLALRVAFYSDLHPKTIAKGPTKAATQPLSPAKTPASSADTKKAAESDSGPQIPGALQLILMLGAVALAPATSFAGYTFLRDAEMEPYRGTALYWRLLVCTIVYPGLWLLYWIIFAYLGLSPQLIALGIVIPLLVMAGAFAAHLALDFEYGTALAHCGMYLATTVLLRIIIGLPPHWSTWGT